MRYTCVSVQGVYKNVETDEKLCGEKTECGMNKYNKTITIRIKHAKVI